MGSVFLLFLFGCLLRQGRLCCRPPQSLPRLGWGGGGGAPWEGQGVELKWSSAAGPGSCSGPFVTFLVTLFSRAAQL